MKRIFYLLSTIAAIFAFTACEDVPEPYVLNTTGEVDTQTLLNETFASSLGKFTNFTTDGDVSWVNSYSCATATGYNSSTKTNSDGVAYLVGPSVDLTNVDSAYVTYEYILRYNRNDAYQQLLIAPEFVPNANNVADQPWQVIFAKHIEGRDYTTFSTAQVDIPQQYMGQKVRIALYFKAETNSSTWEVKNLKVLQGVAGEATDKPDTPQPSGDNALPYNSASLKDGFTVKTETGADWSLGNTYAKATGYASGATTPTITWLISPAINTTKAEGNDEPVLVDFDYVLRYVGAGTDVAAYHKLYASTDYDGDVATATWTDLGFTAVESATKDWTFYAAPSITLPKEFVGKEKVVFAFRFECNDQNSTTWELQNFRVHQGNNDTPDIPDVPQPTGDNLIANGDFETWSGNEPIEPVYWKSTTTASTKGALSQSNEAHSGSYSVKLAGKTSANQRLAYKEITLKAGTYFVKFFAKSATEKTASITQGYAIVGDDGKIPSNGGYIYGDYTDNLPTDWTEVNYNFTLNEPTTINLVIMTHKKVGADVLVDDYELTTSDGGLVSGGETPGDEPGDEPGGETTNGIYSIDFTKSVEGWNIVDNEKGELNYVWTQDTRYGIKASAYYQQKRYTTESWYISPVIALPETATGTITLNFSHALNYMTEGWAADRVVSVNIRIAGSNEWTKLEVSQWPSGKDFNYVDATALLDQYTGKSVEIGFRYASIYQDENTYCVPTWEIKTLSIK